VLLLGDPEEDDRRHTEPDALLDLADEIADREAAEGGQVRIRSRVRADEQRIDEVGQVEPSLANQVAEGGRTPQPSQSDGREGRESRRLLLIEAHVDNLRASPSVARRTVGPDLARRRKSQTPRRPGNQRATRVDQPTSTAWDWSFETDGALALDR